MNHKIFQTFKKVTFREADPAKIMFFGNIYGFAHDAFEEFIVAAGFTWNEWFQTTEFMIPIRHSEANFLMPFQPGNTYSVYVNVEKIGNSSFQMKYEFCNDKTIHSVVKMTHVVLDQKTKAKIEIPNSIKLKLLPYLKETHE